MKNIGRKTIVLFMAAVLLCKPLFVWAQPMAKPAAQPQYAGIDISLEGGYNYERFKNDKITLNVYNWGEYISTGTDGESLDVNAAFTELTGIKINYTTFDTNESLYSKLKSGGAEYDIIIPSDYMVGRMIEQDMLAPLNFANIPNYGMIGEQYKNMQFDPQNAYSVPYTWGYVGLVYNTEMVDKTVDSWQLLWDPDYTGDILMFDNSRDAFAIASKLLGKSLNPKSVEDIEEAAKLLREQRVVVQAYVMDQIFDKMEGEEAALAPYYAGDAIMMMEENPNLGFAVPKEGTNYFVDSMCIPKNSAKKEAAEMYINFMCETQVAVANTLAHGYSTPQVQAEAALPKEIRENPIAYPTLEEMENMEDFTVLPAELNAYMDKAWTDMRSYNEEGNGWVIIIMMLLMLALAVVMFILRYRKKKRNRY